MPGQYSLSLTRLYDFLMVSTLSLIFLFRAKDPIFSLATPLQPEEVNSCTREVIAPPNGQEGCSPEPGEQTEEATAVQGGWFGRGYGKGRKKKKPA